MSAALLSHEGREMETFDDWLSSQDETPSSPRRGNGLPLRVMVVVDATKDLTMDALEWALINVVQSGDTVRLLGVIHDGEDLCGVNLKVALQTLCSRLSVCWQSHPEFQQVDDQLVEDEISRKKVMFESLNMLQHFHRICEKKGVKLDVKIVAGIPKYVVVQQALSLDATWVILDRELRRSKRYFERNIHRNVVLMKRSNVGDIIRVHHY